MFTTHIASSLRRAVGVFTSVSHFCTSHINISFHHHRKYTKSASSTATTWATNRLCADKESTEETVVDSLGCAQEVFLSLLSQTLFQNFAIIKYVFILRVYNTCDLG